MANARLCSVFGCCKPAKSRGWCNTHYERWRKNGGPTKFAQPIPRIDRFLDKVSPEPNSGCWIWTATADRRGYGLLGTGSSTSERANRSSYKLFKGRIPTGMLVCHKCDVPSCVNPDHLFLGSALDNMTDAKNKGRMAKGEDSGVARLTCEGVAFIRSSPLSERKVAAILGVHRGAVNAVRSGRTWGHLP